MAEKIVDISKITAISPIAKIAGDAKKKFTIPKTEDKSSDGSSGAAFQKLLDECMESEREL